MWALRHCQNSCPCVVFATFWALDLSFANYLRKVEISYLSTVQDLGFVSGWFRNSLRLLYGLIMYGRFKVIWGCFLGFLNVVVIASLGMCRGGSLLLSFMLFYCLFRVDVWCLFRLGIRISNPLHPTAARRGREKGRVQWVLDGGAITWAEINLIPSSKLTCCYGKSHENG